MGVVCVKLVTGEEVIGKEVGTLTLSNPMIITVQPAGNGKFGLSLFPFSFATKDAEVTLRETALVTSFYSPAPEVERNYLQQVSGLDLSMAGVL